MSMAASTAASRPRVLVTGATGFVGQIACETLSRAGFEVRAAVRTSSAAAPFATEKAVIGDICATTQWSDALSGVDFVLHLAARAHVMGDTEASAGLYIETNARGSRRLAEEAARMRVRRLVFLSSVKVNGETSGERAFTAEDDPSPKDAYGRSKMLAEEHLRQVSASSGIEVVCVRSPLVYGPRVRANFLRLLRWVDGERPLPFNSVRNRRSLVSVWNLCSLLAHTAIHPAAAGRTWMVADGEDLSTPDLIRRLSAAMGRTPRLLSVPTWLLETAGAAVGKRAEVVRLCSSLAVDSRSTRADLNWVPPLSLDEGIARTVRWYLHERCNQ